MLKSINKQNMPRKKSKNDEQLLTYPIIARVMKTPIIGWNYHFPIKTILGIMIINALKEMKIRFCYTNLDLRIDRITFVYRIVNVFYI